MSRRWSAAAPIAALGLWLLIIGAWTHGFQAFTSFSAAVAAAGPLPRRAPSLPVVDEQGERWDLGAPSAQYRLVQAMYLNCPEACPIAMAGTGRLASQLKDLIPGRLRVVSLSIDNDPPEALRGMWAAHGSHAGWSMAALTTSPVEPPLEQLGVFMFRRSDGLINHGLYLFLIDPSGEVVDVFSPDDDMGAVARQIRARLG